MSLSQGAGVSGRTKIVLLSHLIRRLCTMEKKFKCMCGRVNDGRNCQCGALLVRSPEELSAAVYAVERPKVGREETTADWWEGAYRE